MPAPLVGDDDHPLLFELKNIRAALARCREESHASQVKFRRRSFDTGQSHERAAHLKRENDLLKAELAVLRATPAQSEPSSESQAPIQELALSLRRLSHKLTLTEEVLLEKTKALLNTQADVAKAQAARDAANGLVAEFRAREEAERITVKDLALKVRKQEEELRMSDVVISEYAELVRQLEARSKAGDQSNADAIRTKISTLDSALSHGRFDLQQVIEGFRSQHDETYQELETTRGELRIARSQLFAKEQAEHVVMEDLALTKAELDQLKINDGTAAKMVARYMQFSQSSTNSLLASLETLKTRHAATMSTLSSQNQFLLTRMHSLELQNEHFRSSLDDLGGEVLKEKYGRRREIGLRIRMGGREQRIAEGLRRWVRQSEEAVKRLDCKDTEAQGENVENQWNNALLTLSQDARILLDSLEHGGADEETAVSLSGTRARELIVRGGVDELLEELRIETEQRVMLQISGIDTAVDVVEQDDLEPKSGHKCSRKNSQDVSGSSLSLHNQIRGDTLGGGRTVGVTLSSPDVEDGNAQSGIFHVEEIVFPRDPSSSPHLVEDTDTVPDKISTHNHDDSRQLETNEDALSPYNQTDENLELPSHSTGTPVLPPTMNGLPDDSLPTPIATHDNVDGYTGSLAALSEGDFLTLDLAYPANSDPQSISRQKILPDSQETLHMDVANLNSHSPLTSDVAELPMPDMSEGADGPPPRSLLAELAEVNKRYDLFQREFRDCHLALEGLKASLASLSSSQSRSSSTEAHSLPAELLRPAVARLEDFTEDVRVELEIKIGDEALLIKGYEALLRVPGALSSYTRNVEGSSGTSSVSRGIEQQVKAFVDGTDPTVKRTGEMFTAKLEDVQHDIAVLKRAIHDPESILSEELPPASASSSSTSLASTQKMEQGFNPPARGSWSSWIRGSSRRTTPTSGTFGNIVTSPRLRQSSLQMADQSHKFKEGERSRGLGILGNFVSLAGKDAPPPRDPLSVLALRIAMPSLNTDGYGVGGNGLQASPTARSGSTPYPSSLGVGPPPSPRPRTSSTMYMLGLGVFGGSGRVPSGASINTNGPDATNLKGGMDDGEKVLNDTEDAAHDVE